MTSTAHYANWKAPGQDGQFLIWPDPADLLGEISENIRTLTRANHVRIQNVALPELRRAQRRWLGHGDDQQPLIASGHQTELYHPGVWVKDALAHTVAGKTGGEAYHFAVDTDHPKHLELRWPGAKIPLTDDPAASTAAWSGLVAAPTPGHLQFIEEQLNVATAGWGFEPLLGQLLGSLRRLSLEPVGLSTALTAAGHELDWQLGLGHHAMLVSPILTSESYLTFVHHVLARAEQFAADYNAALADYRRESGITSTTRPMPDLQVTADAIEVPFWLDDLANAARARAVVVRGREGWMLDDFRFDPAAGGSDAAQQLLGFLQQRNLRLSPRALTLTALLRLLLADQFIHGIGGGRYDQVTDRLIARHFGIAPPKFAVTTATLFFPQAVGRSRACLGCMAHEGHRLRHALLGDRKATMLAQINAMPRRSMQRSRVFRNMRSALATAAVDNPVIRDWENRYRDTEQRDREDEIIFDRELFYAIQPRERLAELIERYSNALN